jgi:hypothetical protein
MEQVNSILDKVAPYLGQAAPYLTFAAYVAVAVATLALVAFIIRMLSGACNMLLKNTSRLLIVIAVFGLIYMGLDMAAGGANVKGFSFYQQPFWMVVIGALALGIFFRLFASLRPTRDINC